MYQARVAALRRVAAAPSIHQWDIAMVTQTPPLTTDRANGQPRVVETYGTQPPRPVDQPTRVTARRLDAALPDTAASRGLAQMFGLDTRAAILAVLVDLMVFAGDTLSVETLLPLGIAVAAALGVIVYKIQRKWYNDDRDSALIKAMIVGLLTAIPVPLTPLIAIPSGIFGMVKSIRHK